MILDSETEEIKGINLLKNCDHSRDLGRKFLIFIALKVLLSCYECQINS